MCIDCVVGNGIWGVRASLLTAIGFVTNPKVVQNVSLSNNVLSIVLPFSDTPKNAVLERVVTARSTLTGNLPTVEAADWIKAHPAVAPVFTFFNVSADGSEASGRKAQSPHLLSQCLHVLETEELLSPDEIARLLDQVVAFWLDEAPQPDASKSKREHGLERLCEKSGLGAAHHEQERQRPMATALARAIRQRFL